MYVTERLMSRILIFILPSQGESERGSSGALPTNMGILFSRVGDLFLIEFKSNSHCFYNIITTIGLVGSL